MGLVVLVASCEKDYTCTCTPSESYTENGSTDSETYPATTTIFKGVAKSVAEKNCMALEYEQSGIDSGVSYTYKQKNDCSLK